MAVVRPRCPWFIHGFTLGVGRSGIALRAGAVLFSAMMGWLGPRPAQAGTSCLPDECNDRECLFDGVKNSPLGQAELKLTQDCNLLVQNIDSSGLDGFRQTEYRETALQVITGFSGLRVPDNGIAARMKILGLGVTTATDGTAPARGAIVAVDVTVENPNGDEVALTPDSSGTGTTSYTIRIISRGDVVAEARDMEKATTLFSPLAEIVQFDFRVDQGFMFIYQLNGLFEIRIPDRGTATGDTVQVVSQNPQVRVVEIVQVDTTLVNIPAIEITVEYGGPVVGGGVCLDSDSDGFGNPGDPSCPAGPQTDCNDNNRAINPGASESCNGVDDDCDGLIDEDFDQDRDGFTTCGGDCDDDNPLVNPRITEVCNGIDDNCNGATDEGFDRDRDGFTSCGGDCDDDNPAVNPEKKEVCNGIDDNCDGTVDEGFDQDGDGFTTCGGDCDDGNGNVNPKAVEVCNGIDDNCDGLVDEGFDQDRDGFTTCGGDCNDGNGNVNPEATEVCNGIDDNCDESVDEGFDQDRDGFTTCGGDCDDTNPGVNPEKEEICDSQIDEDCDGLIDGDDPDCIGVKEVCDGIDNDGDGQIDEDFTFLGVNQNQRSPDYGTVQELPLGSLCVAGLGECEAASSVICSTDGRSAICADRSTPPAAEGPTGDATCFDFRDNDCDGLIDHADPDCTGPERCDRYDNDNDGLIDEDFPTLGDPCTAGIGICEKRGFIECRASGAGVVCSAAPGGVAGTESPPGSRFCTDGLDNDCDGLVDGNDPDCQEEEKCDGLDNDNDRLVDEDFPQLGKPCTTGEGHCEAEGKFVCSPDGSGVRCDATPIADTPEGPSGCSCFDGIDNDCDGGIDAGDFNCRSARIGDTVRCSLRSRRGINNRCSGLYEVSFSSSQPGVTVFGQLLAINTVGNTTERLIVQDGDLAFLRSTTEPGRGSPTGTISFGRRSIHWMFAANPVLEVIADDGRNVGRAYCSILPFMGVVEPDLTIVSLSEGDETRVLAAIPLVDPASLQVKVDGVDVIAALGLNPINDFPGGPYRGSFLIPSHGLSQQRLVEVCDLTVRSDVSGKPSANTLTMTLTNMGCGGHIIVVDGEPARGSLPRDPNPQCNLDDVRDAGISHALGIELNAPADGDVILSDAVSVNGQACHGRRLGRLRIAGADLPITSQTLLPGDGENSADTWLLGFEARVLVNDLKTEFDTGVPTPGRVDPGSNRLIVQIADVDFNTSFGNIFIAVGPVRGTAATTTAALPPIPNAFTLALDGPGMTTFVSSLCDSLKPLLEEKVEGALDGKTTTPKDFPACRGGSNNGDECDRDDDCPGGQCKGMPFPLCDVKNVVFKITEVDLDASQFDCRLVPQQDKISFGITTPAFFVRGHASGGCASHFLGVCTVRVTIDSDAELSFDNIDVGFEITEQGILNQEFISDPTFDFGDNPTVVEGSLEVPDIGCIVGFFKFLLEVIFFIIKIITFGLIDISFDEIEFELSSDDLKEKIAEKGGDFGEMKEVRFDNERLPEFNLDLSNLLTDVQITPQGLAIGVTASFDAIEIDPEVAETPGTPLTPAPLPQPPIPNADEVTVAISDDVFNTLLGGLARGGILKTLFEDRRELGDFLPDPADCSGLGPVREPRCVGMNGGDCSQFATQIQRNRCESAAERFESRNLRRNTVIILHGRADNPPKLLIDDDPRTLPIEVHLRYSQIAIGIFADRDGDGVLEGTPGSIPSCFGSNQSTTTECALWEACLNVNVPMIVGIPPDRLTLQFEVLDFQHDLSTGTLCGGGIEDEDDDLILESARGQTLDLLNQRLREGIPELDSMGLNFGGLVEFQNPRLIAIENDGNPEFQDYIAITGRLVVPEP